MVARDAAAKRNWLHRADGIELLRYLQTDVYSGLHGTAIRFCAHANAENCHCGVRPERRTTSRHITVSLAAKAAASVGVLEKRRAPPAKNRFCVDCSAAISFCAVASLSTMAGAVAIGMT